MKRICKIGVYILLATALLLCAFSGREAFAETQEDKEFTLSMSCSYNVGWDGNAIEVYVDNVLVETVTIESGTSGYWTMPYDEAKAYRFQWVQGTENRGCSYWLRLDDEVLDYKSSGAGYSDGKIIATVCPGHEWAEVCCTAPKTCTVCGQTEGDPLPHEYGDGYDCLMCGGRMQLSVTLYQPYMLGGSTCAVKVYKGETLLDTVTLGSVSSLVYSVDYDPTMPYTFVWVKGTFTNYITTSIKLADQLLYKMDKGDAAWMDDGELLLSIPVAEHTILLELGDTYGDTWNGCAIQIYEEGKLVQTATLGSGLKEGTWSMPYNPAKEYSFKWVKGNYPGECSFNLWLDGEKVKSVAAGGCSSLANGALLYTQTNTQVEITLKDTYGDGWNGNKIEMYCNGELMDTLTLESGESQATFNYPFDRMNRYEFKWVKGMYSNECSVDITLDGTGQVLSTENCSVYANDQVIATLGAVANGTCSSGGKWAVTPSGALLLAGSGPIYGGGWNEYANDIVYAYVYDGVTEINGLSNLPNLKEVRLPGSLRVIGSGAFEFTALESIEIPEGVTTIEGFAFQGAKLQEVTIPSTVTSIGMMAFNSGTVKEIHFLGNAPAFDEYALYGVTADAFYSANSNWPDSAKQDYGGTINWGMKSTFGNNMTWVLQEDGTLIISGTGTMPNWKNNSTANLPPWYAKRFNITKVVVEDGVTNLGDMAFYNLLYVTEIRLPESLTKINRWAFWYCKALEQLHLPSSLRTVDTYAFSHATGLREITVAEDNPVFSSVDGVLYNKNVTTLYTWPAAKGNAAIPDTVTEIETAAFSDNKSITEIVIPASVTTVCPFAFDDCVNLTTVTIEKDPYIYPRAFEECGKLENIFVGEESTLYCSIDGVLYSKDLTELVLCPPQKESIDIPESVTTIRESAFRQCDKLTQIELPENLQTIEQNAFWFCSKLEYLEILEGVDRIYGFTFAGCYNLKTIVIPESITKFDSLPFANSSGVRHLLYPGTEEQWQAIQKFDMGLPDDVVYTYNYVAGEEYHTWQGGTCTTAGECTICGVTGASLGHSWQDATCTTPATCSLCGATTGNTIPHTYANGICTVCGTYYVNFQSASISLAGNIAINFYVELGQPILDDESAYMSFTLPDGTTKTAMLSDAEVSVKNGVTRYVFTCEVHAKQMADMVVAQMHLGTGAPVGDSRSYSVVTYAGYIIAHEDQYAAYPSLVNLLKTMLNYGAYSQIHFGYNVNNLANANLNLTLNDVTLQDVEAYRPKRAGSMTGLEITSVTLILRSETVLRFYYTLASGYNIEDYNFVVNGQAVRPIYNQDNGRYYVDVTNIAAKDLDREFGVTVTNKAGTESLSVIASAMSYVYQVITNPTYFAQDVKDVVKAMYAYNIAANAYFK